MAISEKGKRRLTVRNGRYLWYVFDKYDQTAFDGLQVMVTAQDRSLIVHYGIQQPDQSRTAVIRRGIRAPSVRMRCPQFETDDGTMTPHATRKLIEWCLDEAPQPRRPTNRRPDP